MRLKKVILKRFCGFKEFELEIGDFTVLVGSNNGGKTTLLRAIKFGLDAFRIGFGDQEKPNYGQWQAPTHRLGLAPVASRLSQLQIDQLYFVRRRREPSWVTLTFERGTDEVQVEAECESAHDNITLRVTLAGNNLSDQTEQVAHDLIDELYGMTAEFVPPPGSISPTEPLLDWQQLQGELAKGKYAETWRNRLQWMNEGRDPELFQRVVDRVQKQVPDVRIRPPRRSKKSQTVDVNYVENGVEYDVSASGGGVRTLITVAAALELSDARILLFDEPESHLHPTVQRQIAALLEDAAIEGRQILAATHAPDFIEEVALDGLVWVDRSKSKAQNCDEVGKVLVDLGAIGHTHALQHIGADALIYVEGNADRHVFSAIFDRSDNGELAGRCILEDLGGYGDAKTLPALHRLLTRFKRLKVAMAAVLDADYTQTTPRGESRMDGDVLILRLPCKELENLFLLSDDVLVKATAAEAERRAQHTGEECAAPSAEEIRKQIDVCTKAEDVREAIRAHWMRRWTRENDGDLNEAGQLEKAENEFEKRWADATWRRRCCPGKLVLRHIRRWLKGSYKLNASTALLCKFYEPCEEMQGLIDALEAHVKRCLD